MKVETKQVESYQIEMLVEVPRERWDSLLSATFNEYRKKVKMDGFRSGKIPAGLIKKMYGKVIEAESVDKALQQFYKEALNQENIEAISPGDITEYDYSGDNPFTFRVLVEVEPEIELQGLDNINTFIEDVQIEDEDIDTGISVLREERAIVSSSDEPVKPGDLLTVNIQEMDKTGVPVLTHSWKDIPLEAGKGQFGPDADEKLLGSRAGDSIASTIPANEEEGEKGEEKFYNFEIIEVKTKELPEVDDDFARSVDEKFQTLAQLQEGVMSHLQVRSGQRARARMFGRMVEHLVEHNRVDVPPSMIDMYLDRMMEGARRNGEKIDEKSFRENYRNSAIRNLKWYLLRKKLIKEFELAAAPEEMEAELERIAESGGYSIETVKSIYKEEKQQDRMRDDIEERKVLEFLEGKAKISTRKVPYREFMGTPGD